MGRMDEEDVRTGLHEMGDPLARPGDIQKVLSRGVAYRRRRWTALGAGFVGVVALLGVIVVRADAPSNTTALRSGNRAVAGAECVAVNDGVPTFSQFGEDETPHGAPGASINVTGSGFYDPASRAEIVWNGDARGARNGEDQQASESYTIAEGDIAFGCEYDLTFTVPDVPPGKYPLAIRVYDPSSMFAVTSELTFEVTST